MSEDQLIDLWDIFSEYVPKANKEQLAMQFVKWCQDNGVDEDILYAVGAEDPYLGEAVEDIQGKETKRKKIGTMMHTAVTMKSGIK